ncbi:MAG: CPBP family intramembrane glutamic endopeptidase, partial [Candidatus Bathyarchaeia archaeon]
YALPRLQVRHSAVVSSLILGVVWAVWHLPLNFIYWVGPQYAVGLSMFLSTVILFVFLSIIFTWLYNNTGGSIFAAMILHTMLNLSTYVVFPVFETETGPTYYFFSTITAAIIILAIFRSDRMVREKKSRDKSR